MNQIHLVPNFGDDTNRLLRAILEKQQEQNSLLASLVQRQNEGARQNAHWKKQHSSLSKQCHQAAIKASALMDELIANIVDELDDIDQEEDWYDGNFKLFELIDKYGPKLQQFTVILQTLAQLGTE